jgi:hypothetical protein
MLHFFLSLFNKLLVSVKLIAAHHDRFMLSLKINMEAYLNSAPLARETAVDSVFFRIARLH